MKVCIYSKPDNRVMAAIAEGAAAKGHKVIWRNPGPWKAGNIEDFDAVVVNGLRGNAEDIVRTYRELGRLVYVTDLAMIGRDRGYHYFGRGGLNWVTDVAVSDDRLRGMGYDVAPGGGNPDGYVLVLGQKPGDAQHGLNADELEKWLESAKAEFAGVEFRYRPHPMVAEPKTTLEEDLSGARAVITYNSTAAYEALMRGIPVHCSDKAVYAGVGSPDEALRFLARVAYSNWTLDELARGDNWDEPQPGEIKKSQVAAEGAVDTNDTPEVAAPVSSPRRPGRRPKASPDN